MTSSRDAASVLDNYITALVALERKVNIDEEDMIIINVGISGVGLAAVDLATNVFRAKVLLHFYSSHSPGHTVQYLFHHFLLMKA